MPDTEKTDKTVAPIAPKGASAAPVAAPPRSPRSPPSTPRSTSVSSTCTTSASATSPRARWCGASCCASPSPRSSSTSATSPRASSPSRSSATRRAQIVVKAGDSVDVLIEKTEDREGYVVLSKEKAEKMKVWDDVERAYQERRVVVGRVIERVKGGLAVDIGVRAFLPGSQVDVRPVRNLDALKGQELRMRVIKVNKKRGNIVLSRKAVLEEENAERKTPDPRDARGGQGPHRHRQEHHRVRRLRRPRRHRRPAPHHRHVVGPHQPPERGHQRRRRDARSWCSSSTARPSASRSASSSC